MLYAALRRGRAARFSSDVRWSPHKLTRSILREEWHADHHGTGQMTDDGAGLISSWKGLIAGTTLTATLTARPTWAAASFDGSRAAVSFDGVANALTGTSFPNLPVGSDAGWMLIVAAMDVGVEDTNAHSLVAYGSSTAATARQIQREISATLGVPALRMTAATSPNWRSPAIGTRFLALMQFEADGQTISGRLNGDPTTVLANALAFNTATTRIRFGSGIGTGVSSLLKGKLRAVAIGAGALSLANKQKLEGYYAADAGLQSLLPSDHPYRTTVP